MPEQSDALASRTSEPGVPAPAAEHDGTGPRALEGPTPAPAVVPGASPVAISTQVTTAAAPAPASRRDRVLRAAASRHIPLETILVTIGLVGLAYLFGKLLYLLRDVVLLLLVSGFIALVLNPQVVALQNWKVHRRGFAVAIVLFWGALVFIGLVVVFGRPLVDGVTHLAHSLPAYVRAAEHGQGWVGHLVRRYHLETWAQQNSQKLVNVAENLGQPAVAVGKGAVSALFYVGTTFALVTMLLLEAPKLRSGALGMMSPSRSARYQQLGSKVTKSVSGYVLGDILTSLIAGLVVFITLLALSVPYALLWAFWVALVDFLPTIGGALAGIPTVLFAVGHSLTAGVITAIVFLVYQAVENHVLNPVIMSRTVRVSPLLVTVSVLVGAGIGNWLGGVFGAFAAALLAIPVAGMVQIVAKDLWKATAPAEEGPKPPAPAVGP
jgi:predicted PurR-regulated permease PerM